MSCKQTRRCNTKNLDAVGVWIHLNNKCINKFTSNINPKWWYELSKCLGYRMYEKHYNRDIYTVQIDDRLLDYYYYDILVFKIKQTMLYLG